MNAASRGARIALLPAQTGPTLILVLLAPVVPGIATYFGADGVRAAQQVVTFPFLGLMIGSLLCGPVIRYFGLRRLLLLSFTGWLVSGVIGLVATGLTALLVGSSILGLCAAFFTSSLIAITAIQFEGAARARMVGMQAAVGHVLGVGLAIVAAAAAAHFGWRTPFYAFIAFAATMLFLIWQFIPAVPPALEEGRLPLTAILARIWPLCLAGTTIFVLTTNESTHLPFLLVEHGLDTAALRALVTSSTPSAGFFGAMAFSAAQGRVSERIMILIGGLCYSGGWLTFWLWQGGLPQAMMAAGLIGLGMGIVMPTIFTRLLRSVPSEAIGAAMGLLNTAIFLGSFSNPIITAPLRAAAGLSGMMFWVSMITLGLTLFITLGLHSRREASLT
jgi:MFS family permease